MVERQSPTGPMQKKWILATLAFLLLYLFLKPSLEEWLQIKLPGGSETILTQNEAPHGTSTVVADDQGLIDLVDELQPRRADLGEQTTPTSTAETTELQSSGIGAELTEQPEPTPQIAERPSPPSSQTKPVPRTESIEKPEKNAPEKPKLGQLKSGGNKVYTSTAGLKYGPGSADGHRLIHVMKHAEDAPDKPIHGVYTGTKEEILALIDEAWLLVQANSKQVRTENENGRTVYTVDMRRKVGYTGGSVGKRKNHPACTKVRIVVEDDNEVITAFPTDR